MVKVIGSLLLLCAARFVSQGQHLERRYGIGADIVGGKPQCPIFIGDVRTNSPAAAAGIQTGDRLLAVDGTNVTSLQDAAQRLRAEDAKPVVLQLARDERQYSLTVQREKLTTIFKKAGMKLVDGDMFVPEDMTDAEVERALNFDNKRITKRVFPTHYPSDTQLYYGGFEVFVLDNPLEIAVGGIEKGPASHAGVHWGDVILLVNGADPRNKTLPELQSLFSNLKPVLMTLTIDRDGVKKTFSFELAQAEAVLRENQRQLVNGKLIPAGIPAQYQSCIE